MATGRAASIVPPLTMMEAGGRSMLRRREGYRGSSSVSGTGGAISSHRPSVAPVAARPSIARRRSAPAAGIARRCLLVLRVDLDRDRTAARLRKHMEPVLQREHQDGAHRARRAADDGRVV